MYFIIIIIYLQMQVLFKTSEWLMSCKCQSRTQCFLVKWRYFALAVLHSCYRLLMFLIAIIFVLFRNLKKNSFGVFFNIYHYFLFNMSVVSGKMLHCFNFGSIMCFLFLYSWQRTNRSCKHWQLSNECTIIVVYWCC